MIPPPSGPSPADVAPASDADAARERTRPDDGRTLNYWDYCPNCSARLHNVGCKYRCPSCHYFMSCSDFD